MRPNRVTFDCCICGRTITSPESHTHYCEECGDGPFCDGCWREHRCGVRIAPPSRVSDWRDGKELSREVRRD